VSTEAPIARVVSLLEASGYKSLDRPVTVAGIPFDFAAVLVGQKSLDLIAVVDTVGDNDEERVRERIEGLSRALDLGKSRRPLTTILVGPPPKLTLTHALGRVGRVLVVGTPTGPNAAGELRDALSVLLPLNLVVDGGASPDSWSSVRERLVATHSDEDTAAVIKASEHGAREVRAALRHILTAPLGEYGP
jgi:hypothetical protein